MKNILFAVLSILFIGQIQAQDAKKLLKTASKDFAKYNQDTKGNKDKLASAIAAIDEAFAIPGVKDDAGAWVTKGEIYNGIADSEMKMKLINPEFVIQTPDAPMIAFKSFEQAIAKADKKSHTKDATNGLRETESHLSNMAITHFQNANYLGAYNNFDASLKTYDLLKAQGEDSRLDDEVLMGEQTFYTAISGYYADKGSEVQHLFKKLYDKGSEEPLVYEALFNIGNKKGQEESVVYLQEGRKKFPKNTTLLFAEINYYLGKGELDKLIDNLKAALAAEPDNVSVINTTGSVYEQLYNKEKEAGNTAKANEYFDLAKDYYNQALTKDADSFDANYSLGALYYNEAASMTAVINEYANDYSAAGTKKYKEANDKMMGLFGKALPFFEKAYSVNDSDTNTMIALREIYVRQNKLDKANELKTKMEGK